MRPVANRKRSHPERGKTGEAGSAYLCAGGTDHAGAAVVQSGRAERQARMAQTVPAAADALAADRVVIGVPKETAIGERRVGLIPETVQRLVEGGAAVVSPERADGLAQLPPHDW